MNSKGSLLLCRCLLLLLLLLLAPAFNAHVPQYSINGYCGLLLLHCGACASLHCLHHHIVPSPTSTDSAATFHPAASVIIPNNSPGSHGGIEEGVTPQLPGLQVTPCDMNHRHKGTGYFCGGLFIQAHLAIQYDLA